MPQANNTGGYTGFDFESALGTALPGTAVRYLRFEVNDNYSSNGNGYTGIAEIQFFAAEAVADTFSDWIAGFPDAAADTSLSGDPDGDGIANGIENYFGTHPGEFTQGLRLSGSSGSSLTFTHPLNESPAADLSAAYRWSKDLVTFHADGESVEGSTVTFEQSAPVDGIVSVTATVSDNPLEQLFVRIEVTDG